MYGLISSENLYSPFVRLVNTYIYIYIYQLLETLGSSAVDYLNKCALVNDVGNVASSHEPRLHQSLVRWYGRRLGGSNLWRGIKPEHTRSTDLYLSLSLSSLFADKQRYKQLQALIAGIQDRWTILGKIYGRISRCASTRDKISSRSLPRGIRILDVNKKREKRGIN